MTVSAALETAIGAVELKPVDEAAIALARAYASAIDLDTEELSKLGPKLLAALESLLLTPRARAAVVKGAPDEPRTSPLDELRQRRRKRGATDLDAAAGGADA